MRYGLLILIGMLSASNIAHAADPRCAANVDLVQLESGVVGNKQVAETVAMAYLTPIYGEAQIRHEMPLQASLSDGSGR